MAKTLDQGPLDQGHDMAVTVRVDQDLPVSRSKQVGGRRRQAIPGPTIQDPTIPASQDPVVLRDLRQAMEVRTVRRLLGLTQVQLAYKLGVSRSDIDRWETGRLPVPRAVRLALRQLLLSILEPL